MHLAAANPISYITYVPATDNHHSPPRPSADSLAVPSRACTPHDHSLLSHSVEDILQIILKSRKNWKTLKGQSEAVWPPYLEAIMLKALQEYEPDDSRETRILGRYPMRNRFISDYIHSTTGKYRSAKQVGSRLQQLRDTPEGRKLIDGLTRCYHTRKDMHTPNARQPSTRGSSSSLSSTISCASSSASSSSSSPALPTSPVMRPFPSPKPRQPTESRMPVYIDIVPQPSRSSPTGGPPSSTSAASMSNAGSRPSEPRHIRNIDPTVTFVSPSRVNGKSSYIVLLDGAPVHSEDTTLEYVGPYFTGSTGRSSGADEPVLYNTPLVPKYWDVLCESADPTLYTIVQDVYHVPDHPAPSQDHAQRPRLSRIFSAIYHFQYHSPTNPTPSNEQARMDVSKPNPGSSMTSAFGDQMLRGAVPMGYTQATPFAMPSAYAFSASESLRTPTEADQTLFDEPFTLDVNFEQIAFDDFVASMDNPNTFFM